MTVVYFQALARLGISIDPTVAFPGQRIMEVIRPLINLLHSDCSALENFESLLALCNLAGVNDEIRKRIIKEGGFTAIEHYMFEDHEMLCRAATQAMNNLVMCEEGASMFEGDNDRVKYLVILAMNDDLELAKAASGALAMVTAIKEKVCDKIFDAKDWLECIKFLLANPDEELQHRGTVIVLNMMRSTDKAAEKIIDTDILEILMALIKSDEIKNNQIKENCKKALEAAADKKLIKKNEDAPALAESVD